MGRKRKVLQNNDFCENGGAETAENGDLRQLLKSTMGKRVDPKTRAMYSKHIEDFFRWLDEEKNLDLKEASYNEDGSVKMPLNVQYNEINFIILKF
jgi:hypothetical protein